MLTNVSIYYCIIYDFIKSLKEILFFCNFTIDKEFSSDDEATEYQVKKRKTAKALSFLHIKPPAFKEVSGQHEKVSTNLKYINNKLLKISIIL